MCGAQVPVVQASHGLLEGKMYQAARVRMCIIHECNELFIGARCYTVNDIEHAWVPAGEDRIWLCMIANTVQQCHD